jgi:S-adenosylmethionine decarboxylase proenzyme
MAVGKHLVITIENVKNIEALKHLEVLKPIMKEIADKCNLNIVQETGFQFKPWGVTQIFLLAESHFSCHSYWESSSAYLDIFCCDMNFDSDQAVKLIKKLFDTETVSYVTLIR